MMWITILFISLIYLIVILVLMLGDSLVKTFRATEEKQTTLFSIVIPFRNEALHLPQLLNSLSSLTYSTALFEILLVNDESTDASVSIVQEFINTHPSIDIHLLENNRISPSPKKDAIQTAMNNAKGEWIVTTDADCIVNPKWLNTLDAFLQKNNLKMVVMPVAIASINPFSFLQAYEQLDFLSLMGATTGGFGIQLPFLCNGANLAFDKTSFLYLNGYNSNNHLASGDDHFLLEDISRVSGNKVAYLRSKKVIVTTQVQTSWKGFISQRIRWASKATAYTFWFSKFMGILIFGINLLWAIMFLTLIIIYTSSYINEVEIYAFAKAYQLFLISKVAADFFIISKQAKFYSRLQFLIWYPLVAVCYPFLSSYIAIKALISDFEWKGRSYQK